MRVDRTASLEELLEKVVKQLPAGAYEIILEFPIHAARGRLTRHTATNMRIAGREVELWSSTGTNLDTLYLQWTETTGNGSTLHTAQMYVPNPHLVPRSGEGTYEAVRRSGGTLPDAEKAALHQEGLSQEGQEIYLRLLADKTLWPRALELAEDLEPKSGTSSARPARMGLE